MRRLYLIALTILSAAMLFVPQASNAQLSRLCFDVPGITDCIEGRFREYWEQNGGLAVFGYPISPAAMQQTAEGSFLTQYFERNRFELHPENARPYDVLLGRLGDDRLKHQEQTTLACFDRMLNRMASEQAQYSEDEVAVDVEAARSDTPDVL